MLYRLERCDAIECLVCKGQNAAVGHNHRSRTSFNIPERLARSTRVQFDADNFTRTRLQDWKPVASHASDVQRQAALDALLREQITRHVYRVPGRAGRII